MTDHKGLPVHGYNPQSSDKVAAVNANKELEERVLRQMDALASLPAGSVDAYWYGIARDQIQMGFMALNRAVFQPSRVALPEDKSA